MTMRGLALCALLAGLGTQVRAACDATAETDPLGYRAAAARVEALPEYKDWRRHAAGAPAVYPATLRQFEKQIWVQGVCHWSVTPYETHADHLVHWITFYVPLKGHRMLVDDVTGGEPMTLAAWRKQRKQGASRRADHGA